MINSFIWSSKKKEIDERSNSLSQADKMCQTPDKGGCKFLDLDSEINAFATRWLQRLLDPSKAFWKDFIWVKIEDALGTSPASLLPLISIFVLDLQPSIVKKLKQITCRNMETS